VDQKALYEVRRPFFLAEDSGEPLFGSRLKNEPSGHSFGAFYSAVSVWVGLFEQITTD